MANRNSKNYSHEDTPSGLTPEERVELATLYNKVGWTKADRTRIRELKAKMR